MRLKWQRCANISSKAQIFIKLTDKYWPNWWPIWAGRLGQVGLGGTAKLTIGVSQLPSTAVLLWPSLTCTSHCFALVWYYINETYRALWITLWKMICVSSCATLFNSINLAGWDNMGLCVPLLNFVFRLYLPNGNMPNNKKIAKRGVQKVLGFIGLSWPVIRSESDVQKNCFECF